MTPRPADLEALKRALSISAVDGLLRDKTRPSRIPPLGAGMWPTCRRADAEQPAGRGDPLDGARMAGRRASRRPRCTGSGRQHGLAPHRCRLFKLSHDPAFAAKLRDIVGLYVDPPAACRGAQRR